MITFPKEARSGYLELYDAQGRMVQRVSLEKQDAFAELSVREWSEGVYLARLVFEGMNMAQTKFTVIR